MDKFTHFLLGMMTGMAVTILPLYSVLHGKYTYKSIEPEKVQPGYVATSKIEEIVCKDLDKTDGRELCETYVTINGDEYLLTEDEYGKPKLSTYKVIPEVPAIPAKVVPDDYVESSESTSEINRYH